MSNKTKSNLQSDSLCEPDIKESDFLREEHEKLAFERRMHEFKARLKDFLVQTVRGAWMEILRQGATVTSDRLLALSAVYLNQCHHSYHQLEVDDQLEVDHKKEIKYAKETIQSLLDLGVFKGDICLFHWSFNHLVRGMITATDIPVIQKNLAVLEKRPFQRHFLTCVLSHSFESAFDLLPETDCCNGSKCNAKYDGSDLFIIRTE